MDFSNKRFYYRIVPGETECYELSVFIHNYNDGHPVVIKTFYYFDDVIDFLIKFENRRKELVYGI